MTEIDVHFNAPDKVHHACRLLRKAVVTAGAKVAVAGDRATLDILDASLWQFSATDFIAHCRGDAHEDVLARSPVVLLDALPRTLAAAVERRSSIEPPRVDVDACMEVMDSELPPAPRALVAARLVPSKRVSLAIEAVGLSPGWSLLIAGIGVVLGILLAIGLNLWLMTRYEMTRLPVLYVLVGVLVMLVIGQAAVFVPARRASNVPPVSATRAA